MSSPPPVPTTLVSGSLGVGKTSALLGLAEHQPPGERWVILVNELGEVGIDGAVLQGGTDLAVRELAGGCLCCAGRGPLRASLAATLAQTRPDRLIVEPSGAADLGRLLDTIRQDFAERLALRATVTLVDPRSVVDPGRRRGAWQAQVDAADVLVANKLDLCTGETVRTFLAWAADLFPPKAVVATTVGGELDPAWLELAAGEPGSGLRWVDRTGLLPPALAPAEAAPSHGLTHRGWRWEPSVRFATPVLRALASELASPGPLIETGAVRIKGVFHTEQGWQVLQADIDGVRWRPTSWRGDSRVEVIALGRVDWDAIDGRWVR